MKQYILLLVLMVMGAGIHAYAEDVNPVKEGNVISGHVVVSIRPRACFFPLFSFLPLWLHYNLNPLCVQY